MQDITHNMYKSTLTKWKQFSPEFARFSKVHIISQITELNPKKHYVSIKNYNSRMGAK